MRNWKQLGAMGSEASAAQLLREQASVQPTLNVDLLRNLQRERGNAYVQRVVANATATPAANSSRVLTNSSTSCAAATNSTAEAVLGAVVGAQLGLLVGGLPGSVLGLFAGYMFGSYFGGCSYPGQSRNVTLQPVFFRSSAADPNPTGHSWANRLATSNTIWNKLGLTFTGSAPIMKDDAVNKPAGNDLTEYHAIRATETGGTGWRVFMVDNDIAWAGGGGALFGGTANTEIVLSDRGTSNTVLAHELGHGLGLNHPGDPGNAGDANTIMTPSDSH